MATNMKFQFAQVAYRAAWRLARVSEQLPTNAPASDEEKALFRSFPAAVQSAQQSLKMRDEWFYPQSAELIVRLNDYRMARWLAPAEGN